VLSFVLVSIGCEGGLAISLLVAIAVKGIGLTKVFPSGVMTVFPDIAALYSFNSDL
jgi:hypothetical protein